jgi:hypothetical protein
MNETPDSPCGFAKQHYLSTARWLNLWNFLLFSFGSAVVLFLVTSILLFIRATWLPGAVTTVGTIASSAGMAWVVNQQTKAAADESAAFARLNQACGQQGSPSSSAHIMSFMTSMTEQQPSVEELRKKLKKQAWQSLGFRS